MRRVEQMEEEFGQYNFNFIHYVIQKAEITDNTLTIEGMNRLFLKNWKKVLRLMSV